MPFTNTELIKMYELKEFESFDDFFEYNEDFINSNPLQNIFLIRVVNSVLRGETIIYKFFNLEGNNGQSTLAMIVEQFCLIYCEKYDPAFIELLSQELEFDKFKNYSFSGDKDSVENLMKFNNAKYSLEKHLTIYKCEKLNSNFKLSPGNIRLATLTELNLLANFSVDFTEEYDGNKETLEEMKLMIASGIESELLFIWENENKVCAMAVIMEREQLDFPEIGHVYTIPSQRNKGYSSSLVYKMTEKLLEEYDFTMLYTHGENPASNRAFIKIGYVKTGDYVRCFKQEK
jgi:RimJ/RimL family protein N-acetyltransferase